MANFRESALRRSALSASKIAWLSVWLWGLGAYGQTSADLTSTAPVAWVQAAAQNELRIVDEDGSFPARYFVHKADGHGNIVRDTIESRDGAVARLILRDGKPISPEEDEAERKRLEAMLASPSDFAKHHKKNSSARGYAAELIKQMPEAMIFTYAPGQPQLPNEKSQQVVIDFKPDPNYKPSTMISTLLTGIEGRLWIDAKAHVVTGAQATVVQPVDFGWGVLARIYPGGTIEFEQAPLGKDHWIYSRVKEHLKIREMMFKIVQHDSVMTASDLQLLPNDLSYQEAIRVLLDTPLPTH